MLDKVAVRHQQHAYTTAFIVDWIHENAMRGQVNPTVNTTCKHLVVQILNTTVATSQLCYSASMS